MHQAQSEIDSFTQKFQNLCHAGKDATLSFSSNAGKVKATLSVDLGRLPPPPPHYPPHHQLGAKLARNGPSQQRQRERRAEKRALAAVKLSKSYLKKKQEFLN